MRIKEARKGYQLNNFLIVKQILLVSTMGNEWRIVWRISLQMLGHKGLTSKRFQRVTHDQPF